MSRRSDEIFMFDALGQAELVRTGEVRPIDLVEAALARIEALNPALNYVASLDPDAARRRASEPLSGPFAGVPTLIKDVLGWPGLPLEFGSRLFRGNRASAASPYAAALERAGLVVLGKSATSELGLLGTTETLAHGATRNPWDLSRSTGGSSGGAVAAVAAGLVPIAHASDGGGSIRGPASLCGLFGFMPGRGRTLAADAPPDSPMAALVSDHCVSRSVRDSAAWFTATAADADGPAALREPLSWRLRIGYVEASPFGHPPDPDGAAALQAAIRLCADLGHVMVEATGPRYDAPSLRDAYFAVAGAGIAGFATQMEQALGAEAVKAGLEPFTRALVDRIGSGSLSVRGAAERLQIGAQAMERAFEGIDVLLSPATPFAAWPLGLIGPDSDWDEVMAFTDRLAGYTAGPSVAGMPAMSVPLHWTEAGLPIGCQFVAQRGGDELLLALALELEQAQPWAYRWPEMARQAWLSA